MNLLTNIPEELRKLPQWVCFDIEDDRKVPYIPGTDSNAASNRPRDWRSFEMALADMKSGKRQHVGFCFASSDPFVFIDLDEPESDDTQKMIASRLGGYQQRSVSGNGIHIIIRGTFDGPGRHPKHPHAGIFKECRFCVMTGDVVGGKSDITEPEQEDIDHIYRWLSKGTTVRNTPSGDLVEYETDIPDLTVFELGCDRFDKYRDLANGEWEQYSEYGGDHSTADHAFIAMLCDLTESNAQVRWLFEHSGMWNDDRAAKKSGHGGVHNYVDRTIRKIRGKQDIERRLIEAHPIDFSVPEPEFVAAPEPVVPRKKPAPRVSMTGLPPQAGPSRGDSSMIEALPDGIIREIAEYSFQTSFYPLQEASLSVALMLMSGLCGRGFLTPTKSGLNLWLILVGGTSCGKDEYQNGLKRIIHILGKNNRNIRNIFGGEIVSGPGLETVFQESPRYISYIPEFGDTFRSLANPNAADYVKTLSRGLLNSFNSAGKSGSSEGRRKASGSDEKTYVERPCLCLAGEATPESLYGGMSVRELATGFLQRFILFDVDDLSWSVDENRDHASNPSSTLLARLDRLALMMDSADQQGRFKIIQADSIAGPLLQRYMKGKRERIMATPDGLAVKEVINRAGLKALRVASLLAVSADIDLPVIRSEHAEWAIDFIEKCDQRLLDRFSTGEVGTGQTKQEAEILKAVEQILTSAYGIRRKWGYTHELAQSNNCFLYQTLKERVVNLPSFASDKSGAVTAFDRCVINLETAGKLTKLRREFSVDQFGVLNGVVLTTGKP